MLTLRAAWPRSRGAATNVFAASGGREAGVAARLLRAGEAHLLAERGRLPLWLPVALGGGILAYFALPSEPDAAWRWAALAPLALAALAWWRHPHVGWLAGLMAAACLGFAAASWNTAQQPPPLDPPRRAVLASGTVSAVDILPEGRRVTLSPVRLSPDGPDEPRPVRLRLRGNDPARPAPGDTVNVRALVRAPAAPAQPGAWDFQRNAFFGGLGASGFALGPAAVTPGAGDPALLSGLRTLIESRVEAAVPGPAGAVSAALLTGGVSAIPPADLQAFRDSGLAHLLSVSGLHIAIVMGVAFAVARWLPALWPALGLRVPGKIAAGAASLLAGLFYLLLTGSQVPMQRSFATASIATLAILCGRRPFSLRSLAIAAGAILLLQPSQLLGPSFQMSFAAVLALIVGLDALRPFLAWLRGEGGWHRRALVGVAGLTATSVLATIATTPFGLHHFGRLQLYGVAANAVAVPLTSVLVMPAGMVAVALMPFGLERWPLLLMGWGVEGVLRIARFVAAWPGAALGTAPLPAWGLLLIVFGGLWLCLWRTRWRFAGLGIAALGCLSPLLVRPPDILVSGDARLIAFRTDQGVYLQRHSGASSLVRDTWLRGWNVTQAAALPRDGGDGALDCDAGACTLRHDGVPRAILLRGAPSDAGCGRAPLVISAEPVRGRCGNSAVIDRFSVWRNGPYAVWLNPAGPRIVSDRDWRGDRPWVPPPPRPHRDAPTEPPAELDQ